MLSRAFCREKHKVARAPGIVKFWSFLQKRALFHLLSSKAHAFNGPGYTPGFSKSAYFMTSQLAGWWGGGGLSQLYTQKYSKIAEVHTTAWRFDNEGLVKINFCVKGHEKSLNTAFYHF